VHAFARQVVPEHPWARKWEYQTHDYVDLEWQWGTIEWERVWHEPLQLLATITIIKTIASLPTP
jgi:hypothetical protein